MIPSWLKTLHSLHRGLSRHLHRLPPPAFRTGYGEFYGYTYVQSTSFSTYVGNFTSDILRSNSVKRHSTHFLHQDHPDGASGFSENKNEGDEKKSGDKKNRSDSGGGFFLIMQIYFVTSIFFCAIFYNIFGRLRKSRKIR